uniref:Putative secreted protein n=1 Tax=Ixodes ricinus TaxID=34613 RepID=A0A6B0U7E4_IXORI
MYTICLFCFFIAPHSKGTWIPLMPAQWMDRPVTAIKPERVVFCKFPATLAQMCMPMACSDSVCLLTTTTPQHMLCSTKFLS